MSVNPSPVSFSEITPIKFSIKCNYYKIIEFLILRGAYFQDENYLNNCKMIKNKKYRTLNNEEINTELVLMIKDYPEEKQFFKWVRFKNFFFLRYVEKKRANVMMEDEKYEVKINLMNILYCVSDKNIAIRNGIKKYL